MGLPHFEVASGTIDGSNTTFFTSLPYQPGFTAVWLNGQLKREDFADGWAETSPATGQFDLDQAPRVGDVVQVFFVEADGISTNVCQEVSPLQGIIDDTDNLVGTLAEECASMLYGVIDVCDS